MSYIIIMKTSDQKFLNWYFENHWQPATDTYQSSAYENIASQVGDHEYLLDVGCGHNPFKQLVKNCHGIDPANSSADEQVTIEDFIPTRQYDVITCLGSINFGSEFAIRKQLDKVVSCLATPGKIFWRLNPGRIDHGNQYCQQIDFFPWTLSKLREFAAEYGFDQTDEQTEIGKTVTRLYAKWQTK